MTAGNNVMYCSSTKSSQRRLHTQHSLWLISFPGVTITVGSVQHSLIHLVKSKEEEN